MCNGASTDITPALSSTDTTPDLASADTTRDIVSTDTSHAPNNDNDEKSVHPATRARRGAVQAIQQQAKRMLTRSTRSMRAVEKGDNVAVPVPTFDRSKGDPPNIIGVVMEVEGTKYTIGTSQGVIKGRLARNQFEFVKYKGISVANVPAKELTLREIVRAKSICGGQGFKKCSCRSNCLTRRCSCLKAGLRCNSACHSHKFCSNVDT